MSGLDRFGRGRTACAKREWSDAYAYLSLADLESPIGADDLEKLSEAAYLPGGETRSIEILERAYHQYLS
jgi:hypothetical protein